MARILEIQKRSKDYMSDFSDNVIRVIESNEGQMLNMNRSQMLKSLDANDRPLIHARTGSARLSLAYAKRTGKSKPNLFVNGRFQSDMFFTMPTLKDYIIASDNELNKYLPKNYGKIFGVSPANQPKAQEINNKAIIDDFLKKVFR